MQEKYADLDIELKAAVDYTETVENDMEEKKFELEQT